LDHKDHKDYKDYKDLLGQLALPASALKKLSERQILQLENMA